MFHIDFSGNLRVQKFFIALDFSNGVFDFQNEIDVDLTHVTASVVGGQRYSRPGDSDIYQGRTRQFFPRTLPQKP